MSFIAPPASSRTPLLLLGLALVLGFLYWAKPVLIPLALAILLTFLLTPAVGWLQRRHIGRVPAVVLVTFAAMATMFGIAWAVTQQVTSLIDTYPRYERNITAKIASLRDRGRDGVVDKVQALAQRIASELERDPVDEGPATPAEIEIRRAQPVRIIDDEGPFRLSELWSVAGPLLAPLATLGLVLVLVIFMLINREDLRDRVIALVGQHQLADTTRAFDDAGERISRYLLTQLIINASFGVAVMIGLWLIGVPYSPLWGFFAAVLRYIPYLGPWLAALLPIAMSLLIAADWSSAIMVLVLFGVLELTTNMIIEPWLYGRGIGVSQAALLVAVAFWTWFWGPIGLVLASPLTVCLVVLGRHVVFLRFFDILLGDRPALPPPYRFYQRLLARDLDEAADLAEQQHESTTLVDVYDGMIVPALALARADHRSAKLDALEQKAMIEGSREVIEQLGRAASETRSVDALADAPEPVRLLAVPARDATDEAGTAMLKELIDPRRFRWIGARSAHMASDVVDLVDSERPGILCIGAIPPGGLAQTRYLCKRLRARHPQLKILVGRWGLKDEGRVKNREQLAAAGADRVAFTLADTLVQLQQLAMLSSSAPTPREPALPASTP
jgi:predicted PurR-regulated permease PerM